MDLTLAARGRAGRGRCEGDERVGVWVGVVCLTRGGEGLADVVSVVLMLAYLLRSRCSVEWVLTRVVKLNRVELKTALQHQAMSVSALAGRPELHLLRLHPRGSIPLVLPLFHHASSK